MSGRSSIDALRRLAPVSDREAAEVFGGAGRDELLDDLMRLPFGRGARPRLTQRRRRLVIAAVALALVATATADVGNLQTDANATIRYINKHGGLYGHVLSPVYYGIQLTSTQPYSTTMAAICSSWTQDHHVAAGIAVGPRERGGVFVDPPLQPLA